MFRRHVCTPCIRWFPIVPSTDKRNVSGWSLPSVIVISTRASTCPALALSYLRLVITMYLCPVQPGGLALSCNPVSRVKVFFQKKYFHDRESIVIVKKICVEILTNIHVLRSQESERVFFWKNVVCTLYTVTVAGDESTSGIKTKLWIWDKTRTQMWFFVVMCNKGYNRG